MEATRRGFMWQGIVDLLNEMNACEKAGATRGALALAFICMDMMSFLAMEDEKADQTREDFMKWAGDYFKS
jgi:hypothetical protein